MKALYKFYWYYGRMGNVEGFFIADIRDVANAIGKQVCFGEILGKHSDVYGTLSKGDLRVVSCDQNLIEELSKIGLDLCGYNPLNYLEEEEESCDE